MTKPVPCQYSINKLLDDKRAGRAYLKDFSWDDLHDERPESATAALRLWKERYFSSQCGRDAMVVTIRDMGIFYYCLECGLRDDIRNCSLLLVELHPLTKEEKQMDHGYYANLAEASYARRLMKVLGGRQLVEEIAA